MDVDANSSVYAASWKGATFTYAGENVGYVVQLRPKGYKPEPMPSLDKDNQSGWLELLNSQSHRRRVEGQRGLVRYAAGHPNEVLKLSNTLAQLAEADQTPLKTRIAAIYAIELIRDQWVRGKQDPKAVEPLVDHLVRLTKRPAIAAWAIRALSDAQALDQPNGLDSIRNGLQSDDPRTNIESLLAVTKASKSSDWTNDIVRHLSSQDVLIRHLATQAFSKQDCEQACWHIFNTQPKDSLAFEHAVQALAMKQDPKLIASLIESLQPALSAAGRPLSKADYMTVRVLGRLAYREGAWNGTSWGTRPDTRGPYYQPEAWEMTKPIQEAIDRWLSQRDAADGAEILSLLALNRWNIAERLEGWMRLPQWSELPFAQRIGLLEAAGNLPDPVLKMLETLSGDPRLAESDLLPLLGLLLKQNSEQAIPGISVLLASSGNFSTQLQAEAWKRCCESDKLSSSTTLGDSSVCVLLRVST